MPGSIHFQAVQIAVCVQDKVSPAVYVQLQCLESADCESFHALCNLFADIGRAYFFSRICLIFVGIVKPSVFGNDFDRRKCFSIDHAACKFAAFDVSFDDHFVFITERIFQCLTVFVFCIYNIYSDAGAAGAWLYNDREGKSQRFQGTVTVFFIQADSGSVSTPASIKICLVSPLSMATAHPSESGPV